MLIKEVGGKVNFIDKHDHFVGFDYESCCCENFGYYFTKKVTPEEPTKDVSSDGFFFDTSKDPIDVEYKKDSYGDNNAVAFKCINDEGDVIYLHLYNHHNGYYSHGWDTTFGHSGYL